MPKKKTTAELEAALAELREQLEIQTRTAQLAQERLATALPSHRVPFSELMVGVVNISDNTLGIPATLPGEVAIQLYGDLPTSKGHPKTRTVLSYVKWQEVRQSSFMEKGMVMRDDRVLGSSYSPAPADRPEDIPALWHVNAVIDPEEWIESRTEAEIKRDMEKFTSDDSIRRLQRVVSWKVADVQATHPRPGSVASAVWAIQQLPGKYQMVDNIAAMRLEKGDGTDEDAVADDTVLMPGVKRRIV